VRLIAAMVVCSALAASATLVIAYCLRRARIRQFAREVTKGAASQRDAVFDLGRTLFLEVKNGPDPAFLTKFLAPLGPSPVAVLKRGGCCSGIHRLFIATLDAIDIRAAQISVYGPIRPHCLAQVALTSGPLLIDVDYGVWYRHPNGGALGINDLRSGVTPVIEPFIDTQARRVGRHIRPGYPKCPYYDFDFCATRTANWTKTCGRRATYWLLQYLTQGRVDTFLLPPICEWPEILVAAVLFGIGVMCFVAEFAAKLH
jgi:hypothetical protein